MTAFPKSILTIMTMTTLTIFDRNVILDICKGLRGFLKD